MEINHLVILMVMYLKSGLCNTSFKQNSSVGLNEDNKFLYTFKYRLSLDCWSYAKVAGLSFANKTANTPSECARILKKSQYDVFYWD